MYIIIPRATPEKQSHIAPKPIGKLRRNNKYSNNPKVNRKGGRKHTTQKIKWQT